MQDQADRLRQLVKKQQMSQQIFSQKKPSSNHMPHIMAITSGKGGVGKTNITVNLAIALAKKGKKVLIIDADLGLANVEILFGMSPQHTMLDLLRSDVYVPDVVLNAPGNIQYISGGSGLERLSDLSAADRVTLLKKLSYCENLADIILIDTGAGVGSNVMDFLLAAEEVILVVTPEPTSMTDAYAVVKTYKHKKASPLVKLIVNRVYSQEEGLDVENKLIQTMRKFLAIPVEFMGMVYEDRNMVNAIKKQSPLLISYPNTIAAKCITAIATSILEGGRAKIRLTWRDFLERLIFSR